MTLLALSLVIPGVPAAQSNQDSGRGMSQTDSARSGVHDFDFLVGHWRVHHRKAEAAACNSHEWIEFERTLISQPLMGGYANVDDDVFSLTKHERVRNSFESWTLRLNSPPPKCCSTSNLAPLMQVSE
jgi:hypothetical protein